jgi:hypothetical protein
VRLGLGIKFHSFRLEREAPLRTLERKECSLQLFALTTSTYRARGKTDSQFGKREGEGGGDPGKTEVSLTIKSER